VIENENTVPGYKGQRSNAMLMRHNNINNLGVGSTPTSLTAWVRLVAQDYKSRKVQSLTLKA
jgi:hypothetical protein